MKINREVNWFNEIGNNLKRYIPTGSSQESSFYVDSESVKILEDSETALKMLMIQIQYVYPVTIFKEMVFTFDWQNNTLVRYIMASEEYDISDNTWTVEYDDTHRILVEGIVTDDDRYIGPFEYLGRYDRAITNILYKIHTGKAFDMRLERAVKGKEWEENRQRDVNREEFEKEPTSIYVKLEENGLPPKYIAVNSVTVKRESPHRLQATIFTVGEEIYSTTEIYTYDMENRGRIVKETVAKTLYNADGQFMAIEEIDGESENVKNASIDYDIANWVYELANKAVYDSHWLPPYLKNDGEICEFSLQHNRNRYELLDISEEKSIYIDKQETVLIHEDDKVKYLKVSQYDMDNFGGNFDGIWEYSYVFGYDKKKPIIYIGDGSHFVRNFDLTGKITKCNEEPLDFNAIEPKYELDCRGQVRDIADFAYAVYFGESYLPKNIDHMSLQEIESETTRYLKCYDDDELTVYLDLEGIGEEEDCTHSKIVVDKVNAKIHWSYLYLHCVELDQYNNHYPLTAYGKNSYERQTTLKERYDFDGNVEYKKYSNGYMRALPYLSLDYNVAEIVFHILYEGEYILNAEEREKPDIEGALQGKYPLKPFNKNQ